MEPLVLVGPTQIVLTVRPNLPAQGLPDLAKLARAGTRLTFASAGTGTTTQIALELFKRDAGIDITHVPYRGSGPAIADVSAGQVDM